MARITTTVTTTAKGNLHYHFTCNYCGRRNNKVADISGIAVGSRENAPGALTDLQGEPQRYRERIRAYEQRLRAGNALPKGKYDAVEYSTNSLLILGLDGKCAHCGKEQAWAIDPSAPNDSWRAGCLTMVAFLMGGLVVFLIGSIAVTDSTLSAVLMAAGGLISLGGMAGGLISHFTRNRRATKARLAELAAAPNDPDKLPVIDG